MQNLYQGGACNPNQLATSNQFKRMMTNMQIGGVNPQRIQLMGQSGQSFEEDIKNRQMAFKLMNQGWTQSVNANREQQMIMQQMMGSQYKNAQLQHQQMMIHQQAQWHRAEQQMKLHELRMHQQFEEMKIAHEAQHWQNQLAMQQGFSNAKISLQQQQKNILNSSSSMLQVMMNDPDPRFQNSQFLHFLKRINKGQIVIQGKQITQVKQDTQALQSSWNEAEKIYQSNLANLDPTFQQAKRLQAQQAMKAQAALEEKWQQKLQNYQSQLANQAQFQKMLQQKYMSVLQQMNFDLSQAWQASTNLQEQLVHGQIKDVYQFNQHNPYRDVAFPKTLALQLINKGDNSQAILALQAHLQKNMQDGDSWRILGRILQQNDQDQQSITCFTNCIKTNPNNLDCLLSLGISCANVLDEVKAMNYLKRWLMVNPKYMMKQIQNIIPQQMVNLPTYKIQDIKSMNDNLIRAFDKAASTNPNDPQLLYASAILFFIKRQYQVAIDLFNKALVQDPANYLLMNKVGATLAHLGRADQAITFYHRALDIRPNYVRVWVNLGIAHAFKGIYDQAANFYLNALSFRPDAKHIWSYLHTSFLAMQRYDLIGQIATQDPHSFKQFEVINLKDLPEPQISYNETTQKYILNRSAQSWLSQFNVKQQP